MKDTTSKLSVLIIDNEPHMSNGLTEILRHAGYGVQVAETHGEARTELMKSDYQPDVILLNHFTGTHKRERKQPTKFSGEAFLAARADNNIPCVAMGSTESSNLALCNVSGRGDGAVGVLNRGFVAKAINDETIQGGGPNTDKVLLAVADAIGKKQAKAVGAAR